jgi:hypothetical protein
LSELVEVNVFGVPQDKFKLHRDVRINYNIGGGLRLSQHMVEIFNEKLGTWQCCPCNEAVVNCPVCGKPMRCFYIPGTTWLACCSRECYQKFDEKVRELGGVWKAIEYFRKEVEKVE